MCICVIQLNSLRPRQNGRHFANDILKCIFLNENVWIPNNISLKFVPKGPINNNPALVQVMAWRRPGDKPLSEPMMVWLLTHICVTRPQWVKWVKIPSSLYKNIVMRKDIKTLDSIFVSKWLWESVSHRCAVALVTGLIDSLVQYVVCLGFRIRYLSLMRDFPVMRLPSTRSNQN